MTYYQFVWKKTLKPHALCRQSRKDKKWHFVQHGKQCLFVGEAATQIRLRPWFWRPLLGFFRTLQGRAIKKTHGGNKNNKATDGVDLQHDVPKQNNITQGKGQRGNTREWDVMLLFIYFVSK